MPTDDSRKGGESQGDKSTNKGGTDQKPSSDQKGPSTGTSQK